jgi:hypothetical protein
MTAAPSTQPVAPSDDPAVVGSEIIRLNPFDGLFLRASHLDQMEQYAADLVAAVGMAGGAGVVEGMGVTLDGDTLTIDPGLAVDDRGRPLRSRTPGTVSLQGRQVPPDGFWWVTAQRASWQYGQETVAGALCDDPCGGGSVGRPFTAEGVRFDVSSDVRAGLDARGWLEKRSWLARELFGDEQVTAGRWTALDAAGSALYRQSWAPPAAAAGGGGLVRLGVVIPQSSAGGHQLDLWTARRDRAGAPPVDYWQWRLGMRPWQVFVAQILQFQAMLAERLDLKNSPAGWMSVVLDQLDQATDLVAQLTKAKLHEHLKGMREQLTRQYAGPDAADLTPEGVSNPVTLRSLGFLDLPPAGYLPRYGAGLEDVAVQLEYVLELPVRVCPCSPGDVGQAVQEAQHRDRIPLDLGKSQTGVDVLVPVLGSSHAPAFDWVVFVRRDGRRCPVEVAPPPTEEVGVYLISAPSGDDATRIYERLAKGQLPKDPDPPMHFLGTLTYPAGEWAVPPDQSYTAIYDALHDLPAQVEVVGFVSQPSRRPLGAVRAELLIADLSGPDPQVRRLATWAGKVNGGEAIVVVAGPDPGPGHVG